MSKVSKITLLFVVIVMYWFSVKWKTGLFC